MTANEQVQLQGNIYNYPEGPPPPPAVLQLWIDVGNGLDRNQTVVWKSAVESLTEAEKYLTIAPDARIFIEKYMATIISILSEQQPSKIGSHERTCVQESLSMAVVIIAKDLEIQIQRRGLSIVLNTALVHVFNRKKNFYKGTKGSWNVNQMVGLPQVRLETIERFRKEGGFRSLYTYLMQMIEISISSFPELTLIHEILNALGDTIPGRTISTTTSASSHAAALAQQQEPSQLTTKQAEDDAIMIANGVMMYINRLADHDLKKLPTEEIKVIQMDLQRIFDRLVDTRRTSTNDFYSFWRSLVLKLITSNSLPLKLFGWEQVGDFIRACENHRPPPRAFVVSGAGRSFVNGSYEFAGEITADGYARQGVEATYVRRVIDNENDGTGKKLTLFRCTMRSQQKWWFLSEADEEQPGTDRDIDYYQHKSKEHEDSFPPPRGWITCRNAGVDPPPTLEAQSALVPAGAEYDTLEHQLAKWAIENEIVEQVLGDSTIHREVVARSTVLIKFLASMCTRDQPNAAISDTNEPNKYCLQPHHLLFAWKTCTRKADAAVSLQVYQLLVSILPLCPSSLAIPLLKAVQTSLHESDETRDYLQEVSEFCSALAIVNLDSKNISRSFLSEEVREEGLNLLWSVLTHPDASSLKTYENLKRYVTYELKVEPKGSEHRQRFLQSCIDAMSESASKRVGSSLDEVQALRMMKLLNFVLEACPRQQAEEIVLRDQAALPSLVFHELTAYLERRNNGMGNNSLRRSSGPIIPDNYKHLDALNERLRILRYVYGLADPPLPDRILMDYGMLENLWRLCETPEDCEALMVFIASASQGGKIARYDSAPASPVSPSTADQLLSAAFTDDVCQKVFVNLFCSSSILYDHIGESGYRSFQYLFSQHRQVVSSPSSKSVALDALWRFCLTVENDMVATQSMTDLLSVYVSQRTGIRLENAQGGTVQNMATDEIDESFPERIYQCLQRVKSDLLSGVPSSRLAAGICLRILNAAIGQNGKEGMLTASTLTRLSALTSDASLDDVAKYLPHGMRGQASYRRIGIVAKVNHMQNQHDQSFQYENSNQRAPTTSKFSLDVHPLETLLSVKNKVALHMGCGVAAVKPVQIHGRAQGSGVRSSSGDTSQMNLNSLPEDTVVEEVGIIQGCEIVFVVSDRPNQLNAVGPVAKAQRSVYSSDLSTVFFDGDGLFVGRLFSSLLGILESLASYESVVAMESERSASPGDIHKLVWDLFLAMPTDFTIASRVKATQGRSAAELSLSISEDAMEVDTPGEAWSQLLDLQHFDRSVYVLLTIDSFLNPAPEVLSTLPSDQRIALEQKMIEDANKFRRLFMDTGGFGAVAHFFSSSHDDPRTKQSKARRGKAVALQILKSCLFGSALPVVNAAEWSSVAPDDNGMQLLKSLSDVEGLLRSLTSMVVDDEGISSSTITDVLRFLRLLVQSPHTAQTFVSSQRAETFVVALLMWDGGADAARTNSTISAAIQVRKSSHDLILHTFVLADHALPWLMNAMDSVDVSLECTSEYFDVMEKLVEDFSSTARSSAVTGAELRDLGVSVCKKLVSCPRPNSEADLIDHSTGVLCGSLKLLRALIETGGGGGNLRPAADVLLKGANASRWSDMVGSTFAPSFTQPLTQDAALIDIMGAIFDGFLSPGASSEIAVCCDKESRRRGFDVVGACARSCRSDEGYLALVNRLNGLITAIAPKLRHRWGQFGASGDHRSRNRVSSKYLGLRNQGCTCYMNSVLQQFFMVPELRETLCSAPLPVILRSAGSSAPSRGNDLVGKKINLAWDTGTSYDAEVLSFEESTGMHTIRYLPIQVATVVGNGLHQVQPEDIYRLPPALPDQFVLSEGRPGKETGVFEIVVDSPETESNGIDSNFSGQSIKESEDEAASRHLFEEVQRTLIHLAEGSKGRCFDPRALVEACACLKLEFDVWQQNDASEFATKFLDRLEICLKRWAPSHFEFMDHTFGLKQTKQKICKECGLKTNREEKALNIDCQIRGKSDIHEALAALTEVEIMEGSNKVYCDNCKKNTDTILRTAISTLPNMLILSLKRFDLDYTTFETVKLNSRCAFGQSLNMKQYSLEGLDLMEKATETDASPMDTDDGNGSDENKDPLRVLADEDYEYRLAGVLVHAGVAQGGHYYSFIKDRSPGSEDKWYRFDDEDVTPFDPVLIESECFGGKVKKETKWPNGQVHTVEQEQFANALMLFYEKVKTSAPPTHRQNDDDSQTNTALKDLQLSSGYEAYKPDVLTSNASHRWQAFLFDDEVQSFLKGLLGICRVTVLGNTEKPLANAGQGFYALVDTLLSFAFDVMMYGAELNALTDWTRLFEEVLRSEQKSAVAFVRKLARKSKEVSANWLRTFLMDCPDQGIRVSAIRIFCAAGHHSANFEPEVKALMAWSHAWKEQEASWTKAAVLDETILAMPCVLEGLWKTYEDINRIEEGSASSIGIIFSFLNVLLEAIPRCWRFTSETALFIRDLASIGIYRQPMIRAYLPARIVALIGRDRLPIQVRAAFPGSSIPADVAETQIRLESHANSHVMPLSGSHVITASENQRSPSSTDVLVLLEALCSIGGIPGATQVPLTAESEVVGRSRPRYQLNEDAVNALKTIFYESCAPDSEVPGMGRREIQTYLGRCGVDPGAVSTQGILDMLSKYPTTTSNHTSAGSLLSLEGFLAYYRDCVQSSELRLRLDLHRFGFRPNLSRRSTEARLYVVGDREQIRPPAESVALDVAECFGDRLLDLGSLTTQAILSSLHVYTVASSISEPLLEYLVAAAVLGRDATDFINRTLTMVYQTPHEWGGTESLNTASLTFQTIASTPGENQQANIATILQSTEKPVPNCDYGAGLLNVLRALHVIRSRQHYSNEVHVHFTRYVLLLKDLQGIVPVAHWMNANRAQWSFIEGELLDSRPISSENDELRSDYGIGRDQDHSIPLDQNTHSDSDMAVNDSEDDEDSYVADTPFLTNNGPYQISVSGSGLKNVDGIYSQDGHFETACKYARDGMWNNAECRYYIFQCSVSNNTRHWYISTVPLGNSPGTSSDIDFYTAPVTSISGHVPPKGGWIKAKEGIEPNPQLDFVDKPDGNISPDGRWNTSIVEDDNTGNGNVYI